jgi:Protein of unknown function (DUF3017)
MANRPAGAGTHSAGSQRGPGAAPRPVHHQGFPRSRRSAVRARTPARPAGLAWLPYLIVLGGVGVGLYVAWWGSQDAGRGAGVVGGALLAAAAARLVLPPRYAGLLGTRGKALDVAAFTVLGAAVLGIAASLP